MAKRSLLVLNIVIMVGSMIANYILSSNLLLMIKVVSVNGTAEEWQLALVLLSLLFLIFNLTVISAKNILVLFGCEVSS